MAKIKKANQRDIPIGKNQWILWTPPPPKPWTEAEQINVDKLLDCAKPLWDALETFCVRECCGIDALDFDPKEIGQAVKSLRETETSPTFDAKKHPPVYLGHTPLPFFEGIKTSLLRAKEVLEGSDAKVVVSNSLNDILSRKTAIALLEHLIETIGTYETRS